MSVLVHDLEHLVTRHGDDLGSLKCDGAVLTLLCGGAKLSQNISSFTDIVNEFVAVFRDASDLYKPFCRKNNVCCSSPAS
jgi:hypothetical protein